MKFATRRDGTKDGRLMAVSGDMEHMAPVPHVQTLQEALDNWETVAPRLAEFARCVDERNVEGLVAYDARGLEAPLPRAWQWLDGSAFPTHAALMQRAFGLPDIETDRPLMYQGMSDHFLGPHDDVMLPSEADGIDFEAELAIVTGAVPMGVRAEEALDFVRLLILINDWSLRAIAPVEMKTGFGWVQAKPACSMAPVAVTPDELGPAWSKGRARLTVNVWRDGQPFGAVPADQMEFGFGELIAHAARTRSLCAGTVIGSGTVSSPDYAEVGSCCISERRAIEMIEQGSAKTPFLHFGESVCIGAGPGKEGLFGKMRQCVTAAQRVGNV